MNIILEFAGGAELLFDNKKKHKVTLEETGDEAWTLGKLLPWIKDNLLQV